VDAEAVYLPVDAGLKAVFSDDVAIDGAGIEVLLRRTGAIGFHGTKKRTLRCRVILYLLQIFGDKQLCGRVHGYEADLVTLAFDAEAHNALASACRRHRTCRVSPRRMP
jgi:hypothetical protein